MSETADEQLIACVGQKVSWTCGTVLRRIQYRGCRFVMEEWIGDGALASCSVVWVVDDGVDKKRISRCMRLGVPLLAPESNRALRRACIKGQCGLYYESCDDAEAALIYLLDRGPLRKAMGENARKFARRFW